MLVTADSLVGEILTHPKAIEIFLKHGFTQVNDPSLRALAGSFPLRSVANYLGISQDKLEALIKDLNEALVTG